MTTVEDETIERGIRINANWRQVLTAFFVVIVMVVAPIYLNENFDAEEVKNFVAQYTAPENPYSSSTISTQEGQVAGLSTSSTNRKVQNSFNTSVEIPVLDITIDLSSFQGDRREIYMLGIAALTAIGFFGLYLLLGKLEQNF